MNTLKIQIKPYNPNNLFHLKDDKIHYLMTYKNEEDIQDLLQKMNLCNSMILIQLDMENYSFAYLHTYDNKEYKLYFYNDFDDYEDEIEFGSSNWMKMLFFN